MDQLHKNTVVSITLSIVAYFCFSTADVITKYLGVIGGHTTPILLVYPAAISATLSFICLMLRYRSLSALKPLKNPPFHILRVIFMCCGAYCVVHALQAPDLPLSKFYAVSFSIPFLSMIGGVLFFREHPSLSSWLCVAIGFGGVLIAVNPDFSNLEAGISYAFGAAFAIAASHLCMRKIGHGEREALFPLYLHGAMCVLFYAIYADVLYMPPLYDSLLIVLCGCALFGGVMMISRAVAIAPLIAFVTPFQYSQMIWAILFGYLIFSDLPELREIIGITLIIGTGTFLALSAKIFRRNG